MNITKKDAETILAFYDGKQIQFNNNTLTNEWRDIGGVPTWSFGVTKYRVKPEIKELWVNEYEGYALSYKEKHEALQYVSPNTTRVAVHYREVIEE